MSETATMVPGAARTAGEAYFSVRDLHAYYGESYIVQGVSFEIAENEIVALLGRNGAGKPSTLSAIARTDQPALVKGAIWPGGTAFPPPRAFEAASHGIPLVPETGRTTPGPTVTAYLH